MRALKSSVDNNNAVFCHVEHQGNLVPLVACSKTRFLPLIEMTGAPENVDSTQGLMRLS